MYCMSEYLSTHNTLRWYSNCKSVDKHITDLMIYQMTIDVQGSDMGRRGLTETDTIGNDRSLG